MLINHARPALLAAIAVVSSFSLCPTAFADSAMRSGNQTLSEYTEMVKTANGKELQRFKVEYNWDEGTTYTHRYSKSGQKLDTQIAHGAPAPDEDEVKEALGIVAEHPEVLSIKSQQAGVAIEGGFTYEEKSGACARPARCLQVFLFDAENVVRHMLVDMRTRQVVNSDYIPPQIEGHYNELNQNKLDGCFGTRATCLF